MRQAFRLCLMLSGSVSRFNHRHASITCRQIFLFQHSKLRLVHKHSEVFPLAMYVWQLQNFSAFFSQFSSQSHPYYVLLAFDSPHTPHPWRPHLGSRDRERYAFFKPLHQSNFCLHLALWLWLWWLGNLDASWMRGGDNEFGDCTCHPQNYLSTACIGPRWDKLSIQV